MALPGRFGKRNVAGFGGNSGSGASGSNPGPGALNAPISRAQFIRTAGIGAAGVAAGAMGLGGTARAAPGDTNPDSYNIDGNPDSPQITVWPTGVAQKDVVNVQWAVNNVAEHGTVKLRAKNKAGMVMDFNLGEKLTAVPLPTTPPTIKISKALTLEGETDGAKTCIRGGFLTFYVDTFNPTTGIVGGPVDFKTLVSRGANFNFIFYKSCTGADIESVDIYDVFQVQQPGGNTYWLYIQSQGINFGTPSEYDKVSGNIAIHKCNFDNTNTGEIWTNDGIIIGNANGNVLISECSFVNLSRAIATIHHNGAVEIKYNHISSTIAPPVKFTASGTTMISRKVDGIVLGSMAMPIPGRQITLDLSENEISLTPRKYVDSPVTIRGVVFSVCSPGSKIMKNSITVDIGDNSYHPSYTSADHALSIGNSSGLLVSGNTLAGNIRRGMEVGTADSEFSGNVLTSLTTLETQINFRVSGNMFYENSLGPSFGYGVWGDGTGCVFERNVFGPVDSKHPALYCLGNNNIFNYNDFKQTGLKGFNVSSTGISRAGCVLLTSGSYGNTVNSMITDLPPLEYPWYDPWLQFADVSGRNSINLYQANPNPPPETITYPIPINLNQYEQLMKMLAQYSD